MSCETMETEIGEITVTVEFDYQPPEPQTRMEPGCDESIDIGSVLVNGDESLEIFDLLSESSLDKLHDKIVEARAEGITRYRNRGRYE